MSTEGKLSDSEKLAKAREYKEKGNVAYKEGKFMKAAGSYHRAILFIKGLSMNCPDPFSGLTALASRDSLRSDSGQKMSPDLKEEAQVLTCECYNNLAACMLKEPEPKYQRIIEHCNKALEASPHNVKALFRKGISQYALQDYDGALRTLEKAPSDPNIVKYMDLCRAGIRKQDKELAARYKNMFRN